MAYHVECSQKVQTICVSSLSWECDLFHGQILRLPGTICLIPGRADLDDEISKAPLDAMELTVGAAAAC